MSELMTALEEIVSNKPVKLILSDPVSRELPSTKITITALENGFQGERLVNNQAYHDNFLELELSAYLHQHLEVDFRQLHAFNGEKEYSLRLTKKGKVLTHQKKNSQNLMPQAQHNRQKEYLLPEGTLIPPLIDMGIFTTQGKIVASMQDKYRQINHFLQIIDDAVKDSPMEKPTIVDFGCGKSYLTFLLYYYFTQIKKMPVEIIGLDLKAEVIAKCNAASKRYGYTDLSFQVGDVESFSINRKIHIVLSLHACDTATDYALFQGVAWNADMIFSVPCCQKEVNKQLKSVALPILTRYGLFKERFSADLTDIIRANLLTTCGYRTQVLEFVDWESTPKNTLIRAIKSPLSQDTKRLALQEVEGTLKAFSIRQTFYTLLKDMGLLES